MPAGWTYKYDQRDLLLDGLSLDLPLSFYIRGLGMLPETAEVEIGNQGQRLFYDPSLLIGLTGGMDEELARRSSFRERFSLIPSLSWRNMWINVDDFDTSIQTFKDQAASFGDFTTDYSSFSWVSRARVGVDAKLDFTKNIGVKAGVGFLCGCPRTFKQGWTHTMYPQYNAMDQLTFRYRTFDVRAGVEARLPGNNPVLNKLSLTADGSVDFNWLKVNYQREFNSLDGGTMVVTQYTDEGILKNNSVGFSTEAGVAYEFLDNFQLKLSAGYSYANFNNIEGEVTDQDGMTYDARLSMIHDVGGYYIGAEKINGAVNGSRPAEIGYKGVYFAVGLRYIF